MPFEPIAIIAQACLLPEANNAETLWQNVVTKKNVLQDATFSDWGLDPNILLQRKEETLPTIKMGKIEPFEFNPQSFFLDTESILSHDKILHWLLHTIQQSFNTTQYAINDLKNISCGAIIGNLGYPTTLMNRFAESIYLLNQHHTSLPMPHPRNRLMMGETLNLLKQALQLSAPSFFLDAACASSIYAIKLACDKLQRGEASMMIVGGINAADSLFISLGFHALQALSLSGESLPLHQNASGLIPSQGAAVLILKRLRDAIDAKDAILAVIEGIGLSNDGVGTHRGFLAPFHQGQIKAMQNAYKIAELAPQEIDLIECHATGTILGDATEIKSLMEVFGTGHPLFLSAIKANLGHTITASGAAGIIHLISALQKNQLPPVRKADEQPNETLKNTEFRILSQVEHWNSDKPKRAAINCFGFGGNNAHLILKQWNENEKNIFPITQQQKKESIAIVGIALKVADIDDIQAFKKAIEQNESHIKPFDYIELSPHETRFPPTDLQKALGQQLAILKVALTQSPSPNTSIFIGMECDNEITRFGLRWRLHEWFPHADEQWLQQARDAIQMKLVAADVTGKMPNIVTNRINQQLNCTGPSFSVSAGPASGIAALYTAIDALQQNEIDCALVGAVDLSCELVHQTAAQTLFPAYLQRPGDAAIMLTLKRLSDVTNEKIYAMIETEPRSKVQHTLNLDSAISKSFGHAYAASGLLHVAAAALCYTGTTQIEIEDTKIQITV